MNISTSTKGTRPVYADLTAYGLGKQCSLCQNLAQAWLDHSSQRRWTRLDAEQEALSGLWTARQDAQKSWQLFLLKLRWPSLWMIRKFALKLALPILLKTTVSASWWKLITLVQATTRKHLWGGHLEINRLLLRENPENPQHQQAFVSLYDDAKGVTVTKVTRIWNPWRRYDSVTLLRASWWTWWLGYFPTPEAQCLRAFEVEYAVECHQAQDRFQLSVVLSLPGTIYDSSEVAKQEEAL